ncbi:hypothetical protein [Streptomyces sp. NPDC018031]|uniref:hypothetical protein n=1 Tax=Streptomyces sp. NPDC018031 TaxID=3365033 RepID=UPI003799E01D
MNSRHVPRLGLLALTVTVALVLGAVFEWPIWMGILLPTLLAGALLRGLRRADGGAPEGVQADHVAPEPPPDPVPFASPVTGVPVSSAMADYPFLFSAAVRWRYADGTTTVPHGNPASVAVASVLQRVQSIAAVEHPNRCGFLQHWLESTLGVPMTDDSGLVTAYATDVRLSLRPADQQHLDEIDALRKSVGVWEGRLQHERNRRSYLGEDVLHSPGSAVVWWLSRHEDEIERAVELIGPLACLSAAANDEEVPEVFRHLCPPPGAPVESEPVGGFRHPEPPEGHSASEEPPGHGRSGQRWAPSERVSALLDEMGFAPGSDARAVFVDRLARMSEKAGRPDVAEDMRRDLIDGLRPTEPQTGEPDTPAQEPRVSGPGRFSSPFGSEEPEGRQGATEPLDGAETGTSPLRWGTSPTYPDHAAEQHQPAPNGVAPEPDDAGGHLG